jgi:hypothetical protein
MNRRDGMFVFGIALLLRAAVAAFQQQPGYTDAYYYTVGGQRLASGYGFTEPYVWNYLDDPMSLPHPSHLYWMPLPSILVGLSMSIFGSSFRAAQAPFVLLAAIVPALAYAAAWRISSNRRDAWIAALLAVFSGFYLPFWGLPESFAPYAVFGSLALMLAGAAQSKRALFVAGVCAGLGHLTRADGMLLLLPMLVTASLRRLKDEGGGMKMSFRLSPAALILAGYLLVMLPWFARNLSVVGAPIAPAGTQTLWLCEYDELFSFGVRLDVNHWLNCGVDSIVASRLRGLGSGLVHLIAENGLVFLAPLMLAGLWQLRRERMFQSAILYLALLYLAMTLAFTFVGDRGGLFHSGAALTPFLYAAAPVGLERIVQAIARRRRAWHAETAHRVFGIGVLALAAVFSVAIVAARVIAPDWNRADAAYREIGAWLAGQGDADSTVAVGNPPGFTFHTGRPSIVVPNGDVDTLLAAARRFGAKWIVLDRNRPQALATLYADPDSDARLRLAAQFGATHLFRVSSDSVDASSSPKVTAEGAPPPAPSPVAVRRGRAGVGVSRR